MGVFLRESNSYLRKGIQGKKKHRKLKTIRLIGTNGSLWNFGIKNYMYFNLKMEMWVEPAKVADWRYTKNKCVNSSKRPIHYDWYRSNFIFSKFFEEHAKTYQYSVKWIFIISLKRNNFRIIQYCFSALDRIGGKKMEWDDLLYQKTRDNSQINI